MKFGTHDDARSARRTRCVAWRRHARRRLPAAEALTSRASLGKEFIRVIEQTQPEFRDKVSCCSCEWPASPRGAASRVLLNAARRGRPRFVAPALGAACFRFKRVGRRSCSVSQAEPHAVCLRAQFLCYKQLKKFLKQLPDTSVGARRRRARGAPHPAASDSSYASAWAPKTDAARLLLRASAPRAHLPAPDAGCPAAAQATAPQMVHPAARARSPSINAS